MKNDLRMLRKTASVVFVFLAFIAVMPAVSSGYIVEVNVASNCERELNIFCKHVTPGEGRLLACLYAYEDKLSGRCEYALYDASVHIQRKISNMMYLVTECADDFNKYCSSVKVGEGRVKACLEKNKEKVSKRCLAAIKEVMPTD